MLWISTCVAVKVPCWRVVVSHGRGTKGIAKGHLTGSARTPPEGAEVSDRGGMIKVSVGSMEIAVGRTASIRERSVIPVCVLDEGHAAALPLTTLLKGRAQNVMWIASRFYSCRSCIFSDICDNYPYKNNCQTLQGVMQMLVESVRPNKLLRLMLIRSRGMSVKALRFLIGLTLTKSLQ